MSIMISASKLISKLVTLSLLLVRLSFFKSYTTAGVPSEPQYYNDQVVDHLNHHEHDHYHVRRRWRQRYYQSDKFFVGPGSPIFLIMGGEGAIEPSTGLYYPFVVDHLAKYFGAYVLQPEHRFYGVSQPVNCDFTNENSSNSNSTSNCTNYMTSEQAMWDAVTLLQHVQKKNQCSFDKTNPDYCPVITVGGSYPGFLSAMMRVRFPQYVDMAYSASAPMGFYSQNVNQFDYYNHITQVTEQSSKGCSDAIRSTIVADIVPWFDMIQSQKDLVDVAAKFRICPRTIPQYIMDEEDDKMGQLFYDELMMVVGYTFANYNMANYPPDERTSLYHACQIFQNTNLAPEYKLSRFLLGVDDGDNEHNEDMPSSSCFNMVAQLPSGRNGTITSGDWSGVGTRNNGEMWDFQTCTLLIEHIGFGPDSMFPYRPWSMEWLKEHCQYRFGVTPDPYKLVKELHFDDLKNENVTHILFTNGLNDGWSVGGIKQNISDTLVAINFENGAHHSDLSGIGPSDNDTLDIQHGFKQIKSILEMWLAEIKLKDLMRTEAK